MQKQKLEENQKILKENKKQLKKEKKPKNNHGSILDLILTALMQIGTHVIS